MKKFAVPTANQILTQHFGHCEKFAIIDTENGKIVKEEFIEPPVHQPGVYPKFLADLGVKVIIAGGIGQKAIELFAQNSIEVIIGADAVNPSKLVELHLVDQLESGSNKCDDDHEHGC